VIDGIDWKVVSALVGVVMAWSVVLFWAVKWLLDGHTTHLDEKFTALQNAANKEAEQLQRVEKDLLKMQAELPEKYVRREDWIRFSAVIDAKQDTLSEKISRVDMTLQRVDERMRLESK